MIRWLIVVFVALIVFNAIGPWLERRGLGRLAGRQWFLPFGSSALIGLIGMAIGHFI